jgi:hypothetical protein
MCYRWWSCVIGCFGYCRAGRIQVIISHSNYQSDCDFPYCPGKTVNNCCLSLFQAGYLIFAMADMGIHLFAMDFHLLLDIAFAQIYSPKMLISL